MPEYLAPGVFVEEVPSGAKSISGVSTSTIGMVGMTERGPVDTPTLVTNFGAFTRTFGGMLDHRVFTGNRNALPYAVQGAFDNGAGRIFVSRIVGENATFGTVDLLGNTVVGAAATALSARAIAAATEIQVDDGTNLAQGDQLLLSDGPRSEYVTADSDPVETGVALAGRLHAPQADGVAVDQQDPPAEGNNLTAEITGDMDAGAGLALSAAGVAGLNAGDILRIRQTDDPSVTEFVTITAAGAADFNEGTLLFDHPQATAEVHVVTFANSGTSTTLNGAAGGAATMVALNATAGLAEGDVIAIGAAGTREFHVVRAIVAQLSIATTPTTAIHAAGVPVLRQTPLFRVHAKDQGGWANRVQVRIGASPLCESTVGVAAAQNDSPVTLTTSVGLHPGSVVSILRDNAGTLEEIARQRVNAVDQNLSEVELEGGAAVALQAGDVVVSQEFTLIVELLGADGKVAQDEAFASLATDPAHPSYAPNIVGAFDRAAGEGERAGLSDLVRLSDLTMDDNGVDLAGAADARLATPFDRVTRTLTGGNDDLASVDARTYRGQDAADAADRTGLHALTAIDDISIVAVPGQSDQIVQNAMITHCETMRYRIAVLDSAVNAKLADIQAQRALYDSTRAALYYPWLQISDPFGRVTDRLVIPPSGHVCGAFALTDNTRGVHKAPANVVVRNILDLNAIITTREQEILNPRGINVIRDFSSLGRAKRIWGARTISSDSEWRYVPVRRLFIFVEKSIEKGMQFAVFEPNDQTLWATIQRTLTNFLTSVWKDGALFGTTPEEAFFVEVGPSTMTQQDIDEGRLIVKVGIAPVKPAEFVIFRISQKTAGAS
ncbi:phage tail sheath family protein [Thalassococcus sp. BH17M4-6]|uniref:phage tail sheath family protein n=1 Tax=Thalassococcus sp. BH17M4-6 TaxID=3413148 RepID=UPI003BDF349D